MNCTSGNSGIDQRASQSILQLKGGIHLNAKPFACMVIAVSLVVEKYMEALLPALVSVLLAEEELGFSRTLSNHAMGDRALRVLIGGMLPVEYMGHRDGVAFR